MVRQHAEHETLSIGGGNETRQRSHELDGSSLGTHVRRGAGTHHPRPQSAVDPGDRQSVEKNGERSVAGYPNEGSDNRLGRYEVMPRKSAAVVHEETVTLRAP